MEFQTETSINKLVDHLFRHNSGQMVAVLTRIFGFEHIDLIEDAIQETLIKALGQWKFKGVPENPTAWLIQTAKNHILDQFRRSKKFDLTDQFDEPENSTADVEEKFRYPKELKDDLLRMMFAVCDPVLSPDSRVALTLKTVGGFSVAEIAQGFLSSEEAVAKMITRSKNRLKERHAKLEIPPPQEIEARLDAVIKVLYLMFNEGYSASGGNEPVRSDLCFEAIRLAQILSDHPVTKAPKIEALLALFFFQGARLGARSDQTRDILLLADQNRSLWDRKMINVGLYHLRRSAKGRELTDYHLEAEIASCYVLAPDFDSTDWNRILGCFDRLLLSKPSPVIALNRVFVVSKVFGPEHALREIEELQDNKQLQNYLQFHIAIAQLYSDTGSINESKRSYQRAIELASNGATKNFLHGKLKSLTI
ncbi:MAG: sigma-70 family RNA polymerase sigma factor [Pyrinomonadaceae bacterium]